MGFVITLWAMGIFAVLFFIAHFWGPISTFFKWIIKPHRLIIFVVIIIALIALFLYGGRNANKPTKTNYKTCSNCGDRVPEYDMRGKWCKDCQNDAFGEDGWYYDIQD